MTMRNRHRFLGLHKIEWIMLAILVSWLAIVTVTQ